MQMLRIVGNEKKIVYLVIPAEAGIQALFVFQHFTGFRPERRACCLARPEGRHFRLVGPVGHNLCCVEAKGPNNGRALRDASCTVMPHPASLNELDANPWRACQLALLKQGPPIHKSVHSEGRTAGIG